MAETTKDLSATPKRTLKEQLAQKRKLNASKKAQYSKSVPKASKTLLNNAHGLNKTKRVPTSVIRKTQGK